MKLPTHEKIVLAYAQSRDEDFLFITLALYDLESGKWIDMMQDEKSYSNLKVEYWIDIDEPPSPFKFFTSLKMHKYRQIYINNVSKEI